MQRTRLGDKGVLVSGYNIMQRISIGSVTIITYCPCKRKYISFFLSALEMVLRDLQRGPTEEYVRKRGNFWKMTYQASNRVVEAFYVALLNRNHNVERMTLLKRDVVPQQVACKTVPLATRSEYTHSEAPKSNEIEPERASAGLSQFELTTKSS